MNPRRRTVVLEEPGDVWADANGNKWYVGDEYWDEETADLYTLACVEKRHPFGNKDASEVVLVFESDHGRVFEPRPGKPDEAVAERLTRRARPITTRRGPRP
jgi:hypothetical protein